MKFIAITEDKNKITAIANRLRAMGCSTIKVMKIAGVITGDSGNHSLSDIKLKGLKSVEEDRTIKL